MTDDPAPQSSLAAGPCACTMLRKASRALTREYDRELARHGISIVQFAILRNIDRLGTPELSRLAEVMVMDRTSLYRALTPMVDRDWLAVEDAGGRAKRVRLLDAGRAVVAAAHDDWQATQRRVRGNFAEGEWEALERMVRRLTDLETMGAGA